MLDELKLEEVIFAVKTVNGTEKTFPVDVPYVIHPMDSQDFILPKGFQKVMLTANYTDGCDTVIYEQEFQDELLSADLNKFMIWWVGKGFQVLFSCFTHVENKGIIVE